MIAAMKKGKTTRKLDPEVVSERAMPIPNMEPKVANCAMKMVCTTRSLAASCTPKRDKVTALVMPAMSGSL